MKTALEQLIEYSENVLKHSTINAHLIIGKAKQLLSAEKKQIEYASQSKWISVEERLPEVENEKFNDSDYMLCIDMDGDSVPFVAWYNKLANKWTVSHPYSLSSPAKVTHYQPLPAIPSPPKQRNDTRI